jgi:hypothetical protein
MQTAILFDTDKRTQLANVQLPFRDLNRNIDPILVVTHEGNTFIPFSTLGFTGIPSRLFYYKVESVAV